MLQPSGNAQLPLAKRCASVLAGVMDSSQGGSSVASTIPAENSTPSSLLNNSRVADITQYVTSTPSSTRWQWMNTPTATPGTSSRSTPTLGVTSQADSMCHIVISPASGIASTPAALSSLQSLPTPISNPESHAIITHPLGTLAAESDQRQREWQLQPQAVSAHWSVVSSSRRVHHVDHSNTTHFVFAKGRLLELYMWNRRPLRSVRRRLGGGKVCNAIHCASISWSPTLAENGDVLEHCYAAKQHLVHSIWGTHKGDLERGMLEQHPTLDITGSNRNQVRAELNKFNSHCIQSARDTIAEPYDLHRFESDAVHLEFIDSLLIDNKYHFPVAECVEGGVRGPNPMQRESNAADQWPASTLLPGASNPGVYLHQILSSGE